MSVNINTKLSKKCFNKLTVINYQVLIIGGINAVYTENIQLVLNKHNLFMGIKITYNLI